MATEKFHYTFDGVELVIPKFADLPMGVIRKARKAKDEADQVFGILEAVMGEESPELAIIDSMNGAQFSDFLAEWTQGAPMGESSSSES